MYLRNQISFNSNKFLIIDHKRIFSKNMARFSYVSILDFKLVTFINVTVKHKIMSIIS